jgi:hypothetical protein
MMPNSGEPRNPSRHDKMVAAAVWLAGHGAFVGWGDVSDGKAVKRRWKSDMTDDATLIPRLLSGAKNSVIIPARQLLVIDVDKPGWYERIQALGLPPTFTVMSPSRRRMDTGMPAEKDYPGETFRGVHIYLMVEPGVDVEMIPGVFGGGETRRSKNGDQSMILGPWSLRKDGIYEPVPGTPRVIATAPVEVINFLIAHGAGADAPLITVKPTDDGDWVWGDLTDPGSRHDHLTRKIRKWRGNGLDTEGLIRATNAYIERHEIPLERPGEKPIDAAEVMRMIKGAQKKFAEDEPETELPSATSDEPTPIASRAVVEVGLLDADAPITPTAMGADAFSTSIQLAQMMDHFRDRTDAGYEGLLVTSLVYLGALMGHTPSCFYGSREQHTSIFAMLVGTTGRSRKGTTVDLVRGVMAQATEATRGMKRSPNSGEGLIALAEKAKGDPILIEEEEFGRLITAKGREGSTLSSILRQAFDDVPLSSSTVAKTLFAPLHHIALLGNVTREEIVEGMAQVDLKNGFANRIAWAAVFPRDVTVSVHDNAIGTSLRDSLRDAIEFTRSMTKPLIGGVTHQIEDRARDALSDAAARYGSGVGMAPFLSRRLDTIAARIALIYACLDLSRVVTIDHVLAALAVTDYAKASASWVFPETTGDANADLVLRHLRLAGFLNGTEVEALVGKRAVDKQRCADLLMLMGYARIAERPRRDGKAGRPQRGLEIIP